MYTMTPGYKKSSPYLKIVKILTPFFLAIFLITSAVKLTLNSKFLYYADINKLNIAESLKMDKQTLIKNYNVLIRYIQNKNVKTLDLPDFKSSQEGLIHFEDVKRIFLNLDNLLYISMFLGIIGAVICLKNNSISFLEWSSGMLILLPIILSIPFIINFNATFTLFHELSFSNDYWEMDPNTDPIINALPEAFFMHSAYLILGFILLFSMILMVLYRFAKRRQRIKH